MNLLDFVYKFKIYKIMNLEVSDRIIRKLDNLYMRYIEPIHLYLSNEEVKDLHKLMEKEENFNLLDYFPWLGQVLHYKRINRRLTEKKIDLEDKVILSFCFKDLKHLAFSSWHTASTLTIILYPVINAMIETVKN